MKTLLKEQIKYISCYEDLLQYRDFIQNELNVCFDGLTRIWLWRDLESKGEVEYVYTFRLKSKQA